MRYIVKDTHIRHGNVTYGPGDVIELTEEEAGPMEHHLELVIVEEETAGDDEETGDGRKKRKR